MKTILLVALIALIALQAGGLVHAQSVPTDGLVGYWTGNGNTGDSSTNANDGAFTGAANYGAGPFGDQAFQLSPSDYVSIPYISAYDFTSGFSVGFWFYGDPNGIFIGDDNGNGSQQKWFVDYNYSNPGAFELHMNGSQFAFLPSDQVTPSDDAWHQFTLSSDGSNYDFYLDGTEIGSDSDGSPFPDPTAPLTIGYGEPNVAPFDGLVGEVVLYNRALSAGEVQELASPVPEPSPCAIAAAAAGSLLLFRRRTRTLGGLLKN